MSIGTCLRVIGRPLLYAALVAFAGIFSPPAQAQFRDVVVFADASLKTALDEANSLFLFENGSGIKVSYGASAALGKQIESATPGDVLIAADADTMDSVAGRKLILPETRDDLLGNRLVIVAAADSKSALTIDANFPLAQALGNGRLAMPDPAVDLTGKNGKAALEKLGVWASVASKVAPAPDARSVLLSVARNEASLGIVYQTDAAADKTVKVVATFPESSHPPILYPIAILAGSNNGVAPIYVQYLRSPKAAPFFEKYGFIFRP